MGNLGSSFSLKLDGLSQILTLLTAIAYPVILIATWKTNYKKPNNFFALMLLTQAGLMGVFTATDALLFYFFWELALVPVYFLCSGWGHERRIPVTFKFFIYTFTASVVMLVGILYPLFSNARSFFSMHSFYALKFIRQIHKAGYSGCSLLHLPSRCRSFLFIPGSLILTNNRQLLQPWY